MSAADDAHVPATPLLRMTGDLAFLALIAAFMLAFWRSMEGLQTVARTFPLFVLGVLALILVVNVVLTLKQGLAEQRADGHQTTDGALLLALLKQAAKPIATLAALIAFVEVIPFLGFFSAIFLLLLTLSLLYGVHRPLPLSVATVGTTLVSYWLFAIVLDLQFPSGLLM